MKIKDKILLDYEGLCEHGPITIVAFGDSVTHGSMNEYNDYENVYWNVLKKKLNRFRDYMPVNVINAGIGGATAKQSLARLDSHVLSHNPDLVTVCFGLNDVNAPLEDYLDSLKEIFERIQAHGCDLIFMTPNSLNTSVAQDTAHYLIGYAAQTADMQNNGKMDNYIYSAIDLAKSMNVPVCDCYSIWREMAKTQDVTKLLINRINHPTPRMHELFADELYKMIMGDEVNTKVSDSTMYRGE